MVMAKISRKKKIVRVVKRKLLKPFSYAVLMSLIIYMAVGNIVLQKRMADANTPRFLITRVSDKFDETEFMHLLLTVQEIMGIPKASAELVEFANQPFQAGCPKFLEQQLNRMNWAPQAFLIRVKKLFAMYDVYDRIVRLDETIAFLSNEIAEKRLPLILEKQVAVLQKERGEIIGREISVEEYNFIKDYGGVVQQIKRP